MKRSAYLLIILIAAFCLAAWAAPEKTTPPAGSPVVVTLTAEKRIASASKDGPPVWQSLGQPGTSVQPGDVVRYTVTGSNRLSRPIKGLALTQPIPRGTEYLAGSAEVGSGGTVRIMASIDGGVTYAEKPTIKVKHADGTTTEEPAPPTLYTDIRWTFLSDMPALASVSAHCEVRLR